jgi:hypothetical protein
MSAALSFLVMANVDEILRGHVLLEVECVDRLYLNGYIPALATSGGLVTFMREQLKKPIPSPVVLGRVTEGFRERVKAFAQSNGIPLYEFSHKERKDDTANRMRQKRGVRDGVVFIGLAQERTKSFSAKKVGGESGWFEWSRDKTVFVNHYYFYLDDEEFGPAFIKVCSYAPWGLKVCLNGHEWAKDSRHNNLTKFASVLDRSRSSSRHGSQSASDVRPRIPPPRPARLLGSGLCRAPLGSSALL